MCNHVFKSGLAFIPVWGRLDGKAAARGDTLNMIRFVFGSVQKCEKCGTSIAPILENRKDITVYRNA